MTQSQPPRETQLIDGKAIAARLRARVGEAVTALQPAITPGLTVVRVGEDPASAVYVRAKEKASREAGINGREMHLPDDTTQAALLETIEKLNADDSVDGILVQLPLPGHINADRVIAAISPAKDVDGFHVSNAGQLATGLAGVDGGLVACTPLGCMILLGTVQQDLSGLHAVVIGRSNIVGKPMAQLLLQANATVTVAHSRTADLAGLARSADILVAATGRPEMVKGSWIKPSAIVIDVGINRIPAPERGEGKMRLVGDVATSEAMGIASAITPVPGGVGPMTIACLLRNCVVAACARRGAALPDSLQGGL